MMYKKNGVAMKGTMNGWESKLWCTTKIALPWKALWMHEKIIYDVQQRWGFHERHYEWLRK